MEVSPSQIRNFTLLGHIDHGKSTLADRLLQITQTVPARQMRPQFLDKLTIERERGITIKLQTVRMSYQNHILNLIDTPGHVDFSYEVSRSLAACEGAVLLVDAAQGIQAQTLSNFFKAKKANLKIIPVVNKVDLAFAQTQATASQICETLNFEEKDILFTSGKTGQGVEKLLQEIINRVPPPTGESQKPSRALVFDSFYHEHKGVTALIKVVDGKFLRNTKLFLINTQTVFEPVELGCITADFTPSRQLSVGEVGYLATGIKDIKKVRVGETITKIKNDGVKPLSGYQEPKPLVFANLFPVNQSHCATFRTSLEKLALNDASLTLSPTQSYAFGFGFKGGFLGKLHLEITQQRLAQEFEQEIIITNPSVSYQDGKEPWVKLFIYTPNKYLGAVQELCHQQRAVFIKSDYLISDRLFSGHFSDLVKLEYELPLSDFMTNFYDQLKSVSAGFASLDYEFLEYRAADLVKVKILVNQQEIEELSLTCIREKAQAIGHTLVEKLKELIPRQQFQIPIQAALDGKILARADIPGLRKNVTAKLYGGDRTRKDKLLEKQRKGKTRLKKFGRVEIPSEVFLVLLKQ